MQPRNHARKTAYRNKSKRYGWFTLLWMLLCLPIGFLRMWRSRCRWPLSVKYAVSGLMLAALAVLFLLPATYSAPVGGLELYGEAPEMEIYGPSVPQNYVSGYVTTAASGVLPAEEDDESGELTVYATEDQSCYHLLNCKFAYASGRRLTLYEANLLHLQPCKLCGAPEYSAE